MTSPVKCQLLVGNSLAASADIDVDQPSEATLATMVVDDESVRSLIEDVLPVQVGISPNSAAAATTILVKRIWL